MADLKSPRESTIRKLFALSMNQCAFPDCGTSIIDPGTNTILGEVCHICAQSSDGPRFKSEQTSEERHSFDNLILLCSKHHKVIDTRENLHIFTVEHLSHMKMAHEAAARKEAVEVSALSDALVIALQQTVESRLQSSVHMDFRGAILKAGGEGGYFGGSGGDGGVINIVGVTPTGFHEPIDMDGGKGQAPGAGGGGGGVVTFTGRPADATDFENGLRISSLLLANAVHIQGLFHVLGGGWAYYEVSSIPCQIHINLLCVIETGTIPIDTLLRIDYCIEDAEGHIALSSNFDLAITNTNA